MFFGGGMKFPSSTVFALLGAALIAISYGLARFACHALERSAPASSALH
ncbi:hypothetical protein SAMN04487869_10719 [Marinobacter sp. DSM 26671]|nr:hypothetical protein SAMN04487869_10719 [Marinobacter sp. DSM 26671]